MRLSSIMYGLAFWGVLSSLGAMSSRPLKEGRLPKTEDMVREREAVASREGVQEDSRLNLSHEESLSVEGSEEEAWLEEEDLSRKLSCDKEKLAPSIDFMERLKETIYSFHAALWGDSTEEEDITEEQKGDFHGLSVVPDKEELRNSIFSSILKGGKEGGIEPLSRRSIRFSSEEKPVGEIEFQDVTTRSFPDQEEMMRYSATFAAIRTQLKRAQKTISTTDPERESKKAQLYADTCLQAQQVVQQMLYWIEEDATRQHELAAILLTDMTLKVLQMASRSFDPREIVPIKKAKGSIPQKKLPLAFPYEETELKMEEDHKLPKEDLKHDVTIIAANHAFQNLETFKQVLKSSPTEIGRALHQAQIEKATREEKLSFQQSDYLHASIRILRGGGFFIPKGEEDGIFMKELLAQSKAVNKVSKKLSRKVIELMNSQPKEDSNAVKSETIVEALSLIQPGLNAAVDLVTMSEERKKKKG